MAAVFRTGIRGTTEEWVKIVADRGLGKYIVVGEYISSKHTVTLQHVVCGHIYTILPSNFMQGRRCPECGKNKRWNHLDHHKIKI